MEWLGIEHIMVTVWGYPISYVEFVGTLTGLLSVWFAARSHILTWPFGLVNVFCFGIVFYQVNLYADMFLQMYFFAMSVYGWWLWQKQEAEKLRIIQLSRRSRLLLTASLFIATAGLGTFIKYIHILLPQFFLLPSSYPYIDTFIAAISVLATILLARKVIENWVLWILIDILSVGLYAKKGVLLISIEYVVFLCLATWGLINWLKLYRNEKRIGTG